MNVKDIDFSSEIWFSTSRSSGKGGQHVNKTESRVSLYFSVSDSSLLSENQKSLIIKKGISLFLVFLVDSEVPELSRKLREVCREIVHLVS